MAEQWTLWGMKDSPPLKITSGSKRHCLAEWKQRANEGWRGLCLRQPGAEAAEAVRFYAETEAEQ